MKTWIRKVSSICSVVLVCTCAPALARTSITLHKAYIGIYVTEKIGSPFYPVMMDKKEQPYLEVQDTLTHWLQLHYKESNGGLQFTLPQNKNTYTVNFIKETLTNGNGKVIHLPAHMLVHLQNHYYLRYDYWQKWLPVSATWGLKEYQLYLVPNFELNSQLKQLRKDNYSAEKLEEAEDKKLAKEPAIKPVTPFDAQARYRFDWVKPLKHNQYLQAAYAGNIDAFGGDFNITGSSTMAKGDSTSSHPWWNYTLQDQPDYHLLQVGDFLKNSTLLMPALSLETGVNFQRLNTDNIANGFVYNGHTLPNTEVDIWRNGILLTILTSNGQGNFTFNDPNSTPNSRYVLRFYFKDGTEANKVINLASDDQNALVPAHKWNVVVQNGKLDNDNLGYSTGLAIGRLSRVGAWYGVNNNLTAGLEAYHFPTKTNTDALGFDTDWQTLPQWNNLFETLSYHNTTDYDWQSSLNSIPNHTLQFNYKRVHSISPINQLALPLPYTITQILPEILPNATRSWSLKDIYQSMNQPWSTTTEYKHSDVGDNANVDLQTSLHDNISLLGTIGLVRPDYKYAESYKQLTAFYSMDMNNLFTASRTFIKDDSNSQISYRYQSTQPTGWDFSAALSKQDGATYDWSTGIYWRATPYFMTSVTADREEVIVTLSLYGIVAQKPGPIDYSNFGTGTVSGFIVAPPTTDGAKPLPIQNAKVNIGGFVAHTDKNGYYQVSGLPTYTRLKYQVEPNSLDASLVPDKTAEIVYLRPGTYVDLNPQIDRTAGIDGQIMHDGPIPHGARVAILDKPGGKILRTAEIEPNGFFIVDKLKEKKYYIEVEGVKAPPKALAVNLHNKDNWVSNLDIDWAGSSSTRVLAKNTSDNNNATS